MNKNDRELLEQLAQKLGTTAEYLWQVLVKQAYIDAWTTIFQYFIIVAFGILLYKLHRKFSKDDENYDSMYYKYDMALILPMAIGACVFIVIAVAAFFTIGDVVNGFTNPEYWALNKIMSFGK